MLKTLNHVTVSDLRYIDDMVQRNFEAANMPAPRQSHTPHDSPDGYRYGTELFDDGSLDPETHPSKYLRTEEVADESNLELSLDGEEDREILVSTPRTKRVLPSAINGAVILRRR